MITDTKTLKTTGCSFCSFRMRYIKNVNNLLLARYFLNSKDLTYFLKNAINRGHVTVHWSLLTSGNWQFQSRQTFCLRRYITCSFSISQIILICKISSWKGMAIYFTDIIERFKICIHRCHLYDTAHLHACLLMSVLTYKLSLVNGNWNHRENSAVLLVN